LKIFLAVTHKKLQFKDTELDLNGIESAENLKLPIYFQRLLALTFARLRLFKESLEAVEKMQKKSTYLQEFSQLKIILSLEL